MQPKLQSPTVPEGQPASPTPSASARLRLARGTASPATSGDGATLRSLDMPLRAPARDALPEGDGMWRESMRERWQRRAISIPVLLLGTAIYLALTPVLVLTGVAIDLVRRRRMLYARFHLTIAGVFAWHCVGVALLGVWWVIGRVGRFDQDRWRRFHVALENWWSGCLVGIPRRLYGFRFEVEGAEVVRPGPVLLLMRHASIADTMMPASLLSGGPHRMVMRTVKKRELVWDPCVDGISSRLPRAFVRRGTGSVERELEVLGALTDGMGHKDVLTIFPEGTRFSPEKRAEVLGKLWVKAPEVAARAEKLRHVLPARPAGVLELLERRGDLDVVFCAHTGLEGTSTLKDFLAGKLMDRVIKVKFWRVPRREVPGGREARLGWLERSWREVDDWVDAHRADS